MSKNNLKVTKETASEWRALSPVVFRVGLNDALIRRQDLTQEDVGKVFSYHGQKCFVFNEARQLLQEYADVGEITPDDQKDINNIVATIADLEFKAQVSWGFDENADYHNWWLDTPGCTCPVMDNKERSGIPGYIYSGGCPWHGGFDETKTEI